MTELFYVFILGVPKASFFSKDLMCLATSEHYTPPRDQWVQLQTIGLVWRLEVAFKNKCTTEEVHRKLIEYFHFRAFYLLCFWPTLGFFFRCFPKLTGALYELGVKYQGSGEKLMVISDGACEGQVFKVGFSGHLFQIFKFKLSFFLSLRCCLRRFTLSPRMTLKMANQQPRSTGNVWFRIFSQLAIFSKL